MTAEIFDTLELRASLPERSTRSWESVSRRQCYLVFISRSMGMGNREVNVEALKQTCNVQAYSTVSPYEF